MALTAQEYAELQDAFVDAFDYAHLERMVTFGTAWRLRDITAPGPLTQVVFELIGYADAQGAIPALVAAARRENPGNPTLKAFAEKHPHLVGGAAPATGPVVAQESPPFSRVELIDLLTAIPVTENPDGRKALLYGIPGADAFARNTAIKRLDLTLIVDQVAGLGKLSSGATPLVMLIDNTLPFAAPGTDVHTRLQAIRGSLQDPAAGG